MTKKEALADWNNLTTAMVNSSFDGRKAIEGAPFRLHVVEEDKLQGIVVKDYEGEELFTTEFYIPNRFNTSFIKEVINSNNQKWLEGFSKEEKLSFFHELKHAFRMQVIKGYKGENLQFYCPDITTLHKWAKVLGL